MRPLLRPILSDRSYLTETAALVAAMTVKPSGTRKLVINTLIQTLKDAGVWTKLEFLYILGAHDSQAARINWLAPTVAAIAINGSLTFTADRGFTGDGSTGYLLTGYTPSSMTKFLQDDAHIGAWSLTAGTAARWILGLDGAPSVRVSANNGATERNARINAASQLSTDDNITTGHVVGVRRDNANIFSYRNGAGEATGASASASRSNNTFSFFLSNTTVFSDAQVFCGHAGAQLSAAEVLALYNAINTYKTAVGA